VATEMVPKDEDQFTKEFQENQIKISGFQKTILAAGSSIAALLDPRRHDMIACLGETTGKDALIKILNTMKSTDEGVQILEEKPRINTKTVDLTQLEKLPPDTLGFHYFDFLKQNVSNISCVCTITKDVSIAASNS